MDKIYYVIWHHVENNCISDMKDVVGIVYDDYQEANRIVDYLNEHDEDRREWHRKANYWKEEFTLLTIRNVQEHTIQ